MKDGLKIKYNVTKVSDGTVVNDCFVLRPDKDFAAKKALITYANETPNTRLKKDIYHWLGWDGINISTLELLHKDAIVIEYGRYCINSSELQHIYDSIQSLFPNRKVIAFPKSKEMLIYGANKEVIKNMICALEEVLEEMEASNAK